MMGFATARPILLAAIESARPAQPLRGLLHHPGEIFFQATFNRQAKNFRRIVRMYLQDSRFERFIFFFGRFQIDQLFVAVFNFTFLPIVAGDRLYLDAGREPCFQGGRGNFPSLLFVGSRCHDHAGINVCHLITPLSSG
jgi:hypothetical protein